MNKRTRKSNKLVLQAMAMEEMVFKLQVPLENVLSAQKPRKW